MLIMARSGVLGLVFCVLCLSVRGLEFSEDDSVRTADLNENALDLLTSEQLFLADGDECTEQTDIDKCKAVNALCKIKDDGYECVCETGFEKDGETCKECNCGVNSDKCEFAGDGTKTCTCKTGYADKEGTCEACDCGEHSDKCELAGDGTKTCTCKTGYANKEGTCEACDCGEHSDKCELAGDGTKTCTCKTGYADKEGTCEACDCGEHSDKCELAGDGTKTCTCEPGYADKEGTCEVCDCGEHSDKCKLAGDGTKTCTCKTGYVDKEGTCEACDCGENSDKCELAGDGIKTCTCKTGYADKEGTCEACDCGVNSDKCELARDGTKTCTCKAGYADKEGTCEVCDCGVNSDKCELAGDGSKTCTCKTGYAEKEGKCKGTCTGDNDCENGMKCLKNKEDDPTGFCDCKTGLSGDKCEIIDECLDKFKNCKGDKGECGYKRGHGECVCRDEKKQAVDPTEGVNYCKDCNCGNSYGCSFSNTGAKACKCNKGYGDKKGTCTKCTCGDKANGCEFNDDGNQICKCEEGTGTKDGKCTKICNNGIDCHYGMPCETVSPDSYKFCKCKDGLSGDSCETVDACKSGNLVQCSGGVKGNCTFEADKPICKCSTNTALDFSGKFCKPCDCGKNSSGCSFTENGKTCTCNEGFKDKEGTCTVCNCGEGASECSFQKDQQKCTCRDDYVEMTNGKDSKCQKTCNSNEDCVYGTCDKVTDDKHVCKCYPGVEGDICDIFTACKAGGTLQECEISGGSCEMTEDQKTVFCNCGVGKKFKDGKCKQTCSDDSDCSHGMPCTEDPADKTAKFCNCNSYLDGDLCETVKACQKEQKYQNCKDDKGTCGFLNGVAVCTCGDGKALDTSVNVNYCKAKCNKNEDCKNGATCNQVCKCKKGTSGDHCETVDGCTETRIKTCTQAEATCKYDVEKQTAACVCNEDGFEFDNGKCTPTWCKKNLCKDTSWCKFEKGTGYCKCNNTKEKETENLYYDYNLKQCKTLDKCLFLKDPCGKNQICENGNCNCAVGFKNNTETSTCEPNFCTKSTCFSGATCNETTTPEVVTCTCQKEYQYFNGRQCSDGSCFLSSGKKCNTCPPEMQKDKDGMCEYKEATKCDKDCGYGYCIKKEVKDKEIKETCVCYKDSAVELKEEKCVLKKDVCASKILDGGKCKCTDRFRQSANGITCDVKTCADEEVQKLCKSQGAYCRDNWKVVSKSLGYECKCPAGFKFNDKGNCVEGCSIDENRKCGDKQMCVLKQGTAGVCDCIPGFSQQANGECLPKENSGLLLKNIVVDSKKYLRHGSTISVPELNNDVNLAMKTIYPDLKFASILSYKYDKENRDITCNVWLQFATSYSTEDLKRWEFETTEDKYLPPGLKLKKSDIVEEELGVCSETLNLCGKGSNCTDSVCVCLPGYQIMVGTYKKSGNIETLRCEDVDECQKGIDKCPAKTICENTDGSYYCKCPPGFQKAQGKDDEETRGCTDLCTPNPCNSGSCKVNKEFNVECSCDPSFAGAFCDKNDINYAAAKKSTAVVGAVLGTLLGVLVLLILLYIVRQKKNSDSEDFTPSARMDNAEMMERRPVRGVTNRAYQ